MRRWAKLWSRTCRTGVASIGAIMAASIRSHPRAREAGGFRSSNRRSESAESAIPKVGGGQQEAASAPPPGLKRRTDQAAVVMRIAGARTCRRSRAAGVIFLASSPLAVHADAPDMDLRLLRHRG